MKSVGIIQPNYLPWRGYFDFIHEVDVFVFLDDVQYTPRDWRSRNRVKMPDGSCRWITVPVLGGRDQLIRDVRIDNAQGWQRKHLETLRHSYGKAPWFGEYFPRLEALLIDGGFERLCDLDVALTREIAGWLGIGTPVVLASALGPLLLAWCVDWTGSYQSIFFVLAAVIGVVSVAALLVRLPEPAP